MLVTMHTTSPAIMSLEQSKNCVEEDNDGDVLKQESQDLAGLLSSSDAKNRDNGTPSNIKSELNPGSNTDIKEEIKDELSIKAEPGNPGSVGKLPNGDVNPDLDKKVGTPGDSKPPDKGKQESNGNPNTPIMGDVQIHSPANMGQMHRVSMVMSPGSTGMGPHMGAQGGPPMGPGTCPGPSPGMPVNQSGMMGPGGSMGPGPNGPVGPGPNGGPIQQQVPSDGSLIQQQSEIFVFTTQLANEAAQAVQNGQYKNILSYHMEQPNTKSFLQKNPKLRSGMGMYNMRNKMNMMNSPMGSMGGMPTGPGPMGYGPGPNSSNSVAQWVQQQNQNLQEAGLGMNDGDPRMMMGPNNPNFSQMMMDERLFDPDFGASQMNMNLMQSKVPNENLTPEQLQRREEHLASIRKLQQMLFPEQRSQQGFHPGQGPGGQGMMPGDMGGNMSMYQQNMMATKRAMMSQQSMMGSPHGMMDSRQEMMSQEQFMMSQGMSQFGPGPHPQNMHNLSPAQREWMRLQQEYVTEKRAHHQQQQRPPMGPSGPQMGPNGPPMGPGQPPPSYYSSIAQKQRHGSVGMGSPTSPNMNGPMDSPSMVVSGPDHTDPLAFPGHQRKGSFSGIDHMGGPMGPGMGPVMDPMMQQGSPMNHNMGGHMGNMPPSHGMKNSQVSLQRAGNPEQFVPEIPPGGQVSGSNASANKPPPSYAQSQSTKRKRDDMEELCKNLQPTPSPQHISYLNQFDGQELTITKQINTAYRDTNTSESQSSHYTQNNQMVNSPLHAPASNKGPLSNSSQTSSGPLASPGPVSVTQGSGQGPGPSPMSGANMRLSHYDPQQQQPQNSSSISNSPTTPTGKSSLSNITSASLANLAKGVENLSNQMQQHMMQGGPFHSIQMQSQQQQQVAQGTQGQGTSQPQQSVSNQPPQSVVPNSSQTSHSTPSVNNTYVNANLSIQQVNIQSVNHGGGGSNYSNSSNAATSMQVQQMNMEQTQMNMQQSGANMGGSSMTQTGSMSQSNATQSTNMTPSSGMPSSGVPSSAKTHSGNMNLKDSNYGGMGPPPGMHNNRSPFAQSQNPPQVPTSGRPGSPGFPPSSMGNANVQIQQKAPNTIQYLPANQSPMLPETKPTGKPDLDFMAPFMSPTCTMEGKVPTSKMQYFPGSAGSPYGPGSMGPGSSSMGPGPGSMVPGSSSMGPVSGSMGPGSSSMGPGSGSMGPGPGSMGPGPGSMGPGPGSMGPGSMGPVPGSMGPGPGSMGPGPGSMGPGPGSMGPGPGSMGPGPSSMGPGPGSMGPVPGSMGPVPGQAPGVPGGDGRIGPSMSIGQDPRFGGQSMSDLRMDPRMGPMAVDPRMGPLGPGADPRMVRHDARMGPGPDMVMSGDPRLVSAGMSPMSDPRMGPTANSMMGMGPGPGPMGSMRPGSRGSPFTGPIGPAVQQSMMMRRGSPDLPLGGGNFSPDPMNPNMTSMSGPMSALSSLSGNPMTSMSNMSNSIMNDPMGPMGPTGSMGPNMPYNSPPYSGPMGSPIMMHSGPGAMSMQGPRMQGPMPGMSRSVSYSRQPSPGMRMSAPGMGPGPLSPGAPGYSSAQYQQFQQQLYSQGRPRQMSPLESMMGNPGGPGYGPMVPGMGAGMMPNMHGTM